jgi:small subunit ribosomal protein S9
LSEEACFRGTGRRKTSVAQVRLYPGKGIIQINGRPFDEYFTVERRIRSVLEPLIATGTRNDFDIQIKATGGGVTGQAEAVVMGIARALCKVKQDYHTELRKKGLLTRDARMVERKKYGHHKARRGKQFSKR